MSFVCGFLILFDVGAVICLNPHKPTVILVGFEPTCFSTTGFEPIAYTNSATES